MPRGMVGTGACRDNRNPPVRGGWALLMDELQSYGGQNAGRVPKIAPLVPSRNARTTWSTSPVVP